MASTPRAGASAVRYSQPQGAAPVGSDLRPAGQPRVAATSASTQAPGHGFVDEVAPRRAALPAVAAQPKPTLLFFYLPTSGSSRRVEGFLAQVLQRRRNHETFVLRRFDYEAHADLAARLGVERPPAIVVVEAKRVRARLEQPRGCVEIKATLAPWLK